MLRLTRKTWGDNKGSVQAQMIRGMTVFIKLYGNDINERVEKRFIEKLRNYDPARIVATGRFHNDSDGTSVAIARIILKYYNAGRSTNALSNKFDKI